MVILQPSYFAPVADINQIKLTQDDIHALQHFQFQTAWQQDA